MSKKLAVLDARKYRGRWVALHEQTNEVVGHGKTLAAAENMAHRKGLEDPVLYKVPTTDAYFVGAQT